MQVPNPVCFSRGSLTLAQRKESEERRRQCQLKEDFRRDAETFTQTLDVLFVQITFAAQNLLHNAGRSEHVH